MNPERWREIRALFEEALDRPEGERAAWLDARAGEYPDDIVAGARELLGSEEPVEGFLEPPPSDASGLPLVRSASPVRLEGRHVGSFRILESIASGGMGTVWLAEQESPRRVVALKTLRGALPSETAVRRFEFEAQTLGRLRHPRIAQVYEAGTFDDGGVRVPYYAMEYVEDALPLTAYADEKELDVRARVALAVELCDAIQHGHGRGVIHRDLKPANVLVDRSGHVKVIDFGIARATERDEDSTQLTETGQLVGTLQYMAPEQLAGTNDELDVRADVYALGAVLYELATGEPVQPVAGLAFPAAIRLVSEREPPPPHRVSPRVPRELSWIVQRALEKERDRRYPTVAALAADLSRFLDGRAVEAGPPSGLYRASVFVRKNRLAVGAALVVLAAGVAFAASRASELRAEARLDEEVQNLQALLLRAELGGLVADAAELYPRVPERLPDYDAWLARADAVAVAPAELARVLARLRDERGRRDGERWVFDDDLRQFVHDGLAEIEAELAGFLAPAGLVDDVRARRQYAAELERATLTGDGVARAWREACEAIEASPHYGGLRLAPQRGLVPLGENRATGLWEFHDHGTGAPPPFHAEGGARPAAGAGVALVLVPGGGGEGAFFLSKFELTQDQWLRATGANPSSHPLGPLHPVESVSWHEAERALRHRGLALPSDAQWTRAASAGGARPWWRDAPRNTAWAERAAVAEVHDPHVPVGSFEPNAWGFADTFGNVAEWTTALDEGGAQRISRGAHAGWRPEAVAQLARSDASWAMVPGGREPYLGVRPARAIVAP